MNRKSVRLMRIARAASFLLVFFCFFSSGFSSAFADDEGWNGKPSETPPAGMGTEAEPYLISCAAELAWFRDEVNSFNKDAHARLISDIDLNLSHNGQKWTAISKYYTPCFRYSSAGKYIHHESRPSESPGYKTTQNSNRQFDADKS